MGKKLSREDYEEALEPLEDELNQMMRWLAATQRLVVILIEGRDTAGKGGAIEAIQSCLPPRRCRSVALSAPTEREKGQWYFQRYVPHLPAAGELVLFDRSWYNRAGVERVMGYCSEAEVARFLAGAPVFEKLLVDDGILLFKYWLACDQAQQEKRFRERVEDPVKRWKISPIDLASREKYADYARARDEMFEHTHTEHAPWWVVDMNDQRRGRLNLIRHLLDALPDFDVKPEPIELPPLGHEPLREVVEAKVDWVPTRD
jgi:polyphosphate kinase 2